MAIHCLYKEILQDITELATHKKTPVLAEPQLRAVFAILVGAFPQSGMKLVRRFYFGDAARTAADGTLREQWRRIFEEKNCKTWSESHGCLGCRGLLRDLVQLLVGRRGQTRKMDTSTAMNHLEHRDSRFTNVKTILRRADPLAVSEPSEPYNTIRDASRFRTINPWTPPSKTGTSLSAFIKYRSPITRKRPII